jgi:hypothetical protein
MTTTQHPRPLPPPQYLSCYPSFIHGQGMAFPPPTTFPPTLVFRVTDATDWHFLPLSNLALSTRAISAIDGRSRLYQSSLQPPSLATWWISVHPPKPATTHSRACRARRCKWVYLAVEVPGWDYPFGNVHPPQSCGGEDDPSGDDRVVVGQDIKGRGRL